MMPILRYRNFQMVHDPQPLCNLVDLQLERCKLYGKLKRFDDALTLLVIELKEYELAKQFCMKVWDTRDVLTHGVYMLLFRLYLTLFQEGVVSKSFLYDYLLKFSKYMKGAEVFCGLFVYLHNFDS